MSAAGRGHRVVVTGLGPVSSIGTGLASFAEGLAAGASGVSTISMFDTTGFASTNGCEVRDFAPERYVQRLDPATLGRASQFSVSAAALALQDAGIDPADLADRPGVVSVGTTDGESQDLDRLTETCVRKGPEDVPPEVVARVPASWLSASVAQEFELRGAEAVTLPTACAAGNYAIGYAYDALRLGEVDYALCGGADAMCRKTFAGFYRLGTIAPEVCQPFDVDRQGILTGEGAGMLLLETLEQRPAPRRPVLRGDPRLRAHLRRHPPGGAGPGQHRRLHAAAHANAGVKPGRGRLRVRARHRHAGQRPVTEAPRIRDVFGEAMPPHGVDQVDDRPHHGRGQRAVRASPARSRWTGSSSRRPSTTAPPVPSAGSTACPTRPRPARLRVVQNNGFAFGGNNAIVLLAHPERDGA